jgi:hypothetical protein
MAPHASLLGLPRELRDEIYDLTMVAEGTVIYHKMDQCPSDCNLLQRRPTLAEVNKQIYDELKERYEVSSRHRVAVRMDPYAAIVQQTQLLGSLRCKQLDVEIFCSRPTWFAWDANASIGYSVDADQIKTVMDYFPNITELRFEVGFPSGLFSDDLVEDLCAIFVHHMEKLTVFEMSLSLSGTSNIQFLIKCFKGDNGEWLVEKDTKSWLHWRLSLWCPQFRVFDRIGISGQRTGFRGWEHEQ